MNSRWPFESAATVIHSFTPSGVEHGKQGPQGKRQELVIHSFTPSGVEHLDELEQTIKVDEPVIHSFTPSGVEHD